MERMDFELQELETVSTSNNDATEQTHEVSAANGSYTQQNIPRAAEGSPLLRVEQATENNAGPNDTNPNRALTEGHKKQTSLYKPTYHSDMTQLEYLEVEDILVEDVLGLVQYLKQRASKGLLDTLKEILNKPVGKVTVWIILIIILAVVALIILISVLICKVPRMDMDGEYNTEEFVASCSFRGNFSLTQDPQSLSVDDLFSNLQKKLTQIYKSSHALDRYFSLATIHPLRSNNTVVEYDLKFVMPEEHDQLIRYTLSKEMVYHVLLQNLFDQDAEDPFYIEPSSLSMYTSDL